MPAVNLAENGFYPAQALVDDIREVMISVSGRSRNPDTEKREEDQYRLRTYASSVNVRNLGN